MEKKSGPVDILPPNSKPRLFKRLAAGLIDMVILFFCHFGLYSLVLITPISNNLHYYRTEYRMRIEEIKVDSDVSYEIKVDKEYDGDKLLHYNETENYYYVVEDYDFAGASIEYEAAVKKFNEYVKEDDYLAHYSTSYHIHNYVITALLCGGVVEIIFMFIIPLIKNCGQTIGMMLFSLRLYNPKYQGKPAWYHYLGRFIFMFLVESCIPYFLLAEWTMLVVPVVLIIVMLASKDNRTLHDLVSKTMVIEKKTFVDAIEEVN